MSLSPWWLPEPGDGMKVVELFAGVGGFRLGLEAAGPFQTVWFNQWEPGSKSQYAYHCYVDQFASGELVPPTSNMDIAKVPVSAIPAHDLLVGGFPCQDYSVAATLDKSKGLEGKKGVLWWEIHRILGARKPKYVLLENVDRLLKSPAKQRGRDFAILLACLRDLGYAVEWRVINAADYGAPQRRRRVFIFATQLGTAFGKKMTGGAKRSSYLYRDGFFAPIFPVRHDVLDVAPAPVDATLPKSIPQISASFDFNFQNAGVMVRGNIWTRKLASKPDSPAFLWNLLERDGVDAKYFLNPDELGDWEYVKGAKREPRMAKNGHKYMYAEGRMQFPDLPEAPARTILTGEGGRTPNRSTHVVLDPKTGRYRFLTPRECELLNGFPPDWTEGMPDRWRYFTMGNALVVPMVQRMGNRLLEIAQTNKPVPRKVLAQPLTAKAKPRPRNAKRVTGRKAPKATA